jgi:hypothetical protein
MVACGWFDGYLRPTCAFRLFIIAMTPLEGWEAGAAAIMRRAPCKSLVHAPYCANGPTRPPLRFVFYCCAASVQSGVIVPLSCAATHSMRGVCVCMCAVRYVCRVFVMLLFGAKLFAVALLFALLLVARSCFARSPSIFHVTTPCEHLLVYCESRIP